MKGSFIEKQKTIGKLFGMYKKVFLRFSQYHMELKSLNYWINDPTHKITKKITFLKISKENSNPF